jgi:hypothetical protein
MSRLTLRCTRQPYHYHNALRVSTVVNSKIPLKMTSE